MRHRVAGAYNFSKKIIEQTQNLARQKGEKKQVPEQRHFHQ
jgi:hypothetical protein